MSYISDHINQSSDIMPGIALEDADEIERLEKEAARWKADYLDQVDKHNLTLDEFAESQAREAKLRDFIFDYVDIEPNNERMLARYDTCVKPTDDTALREALRSEREKCAKVCEEIANATEPDDFALDAANDCAQAIRAMED